MPGSGKQLCEVLKLLPASVDASDFARRWNISNLELPAFARATVEGGCLGVVVNGGLFTQCTSKVCKGGFCRKCINSFVEDGMPRLGLWSDRLNKGWTTTDGRRPLTYAQYLKKKNVSLEDGKEYLREKDVDVSKIPESEWREKVSRKRRVGAGVVDTDDEGEVKVSAQRVTNRQVPIDGKKKSPKKENAHIGISGSFLRVRVHKETHVVEKIRADNWTEAGNAKFAELYCEGRLGEDVGKDYNIRKSSSKKSAAQNQLAELEERAAKKDSRIAELEAKLAAAMNSSMENDEETKKSDEQTERKCELVRQIRKLDPGYSGGEIGENESDIIAQMEQTLKDLIEKKRKEEELAKRRADKKAKVAAAKKAKAEEAKKKAEEEKQKLMAQLEALKAQAEKDDDLTFDDSDEEDDGAEEFNPFEWEGTTYHRNDDDHLYTEDGDYWGYVNANGEGVEGDEEE